MCDIKNALEKHCTRQCPDGTSFTQEKVSEVETKINNTVDSIKDSLNWNQFKNRI